MEGKDDLIKQWIKNPKQAFGSNDPYIIGMVNQNLPKFGWMQGQAVSDEDINHILTYVSEYKGVGDGPVADGKDWYSPTEKEAEASNPVSGF